MRKKVPKYSYVTAVSTRGQTIIPKMLRETYHIAEGDRIQWKPAAGGGLLVERVVVRSERESAESLSLTEWAALDRLVARQRKQHQTTSYSDPAAAKQHSRRLAKQ